MLNVETTGATLPEESQALLAGLADALARRIDALPRTPRLDLATIARVCVHASSLRTVGDLSDFATRTLGRLLGLDSAQIVLGEGADGQTTGFWRRPESDHAPLSAEELATVSAVLAPGGSTCDVVEVEDAGLDRVAVDARYLFWLPLRIADERVGTLIGRSSETLALDSEET